jgi:phosphoenolpyruvate synthase/pyruvate phosphate dikinase
MSPDEEMVEAHLWMNRTVLGGESEPDMLIINKRTGALSLESEEEAEICLGPKQISQLHAMVRKIEDRLKCDVSVDWAYDNGKLYVLRARPITNKTLERFK